MFIQVVSVLLVWLGCNWRETISTVNCVTIATTPAILPGDIYDRHIRWVNRPRDDRNPLHGLRP